MEDYTKLMRKKQNKLSIKLSEVEKINIKYNKLK